LFTTATVELWKFGRGGGRWKAWLAFVFGIALSLCANVAAAPELSVFAAAVNACPPLAVELLNRALKRHRAETAPSPVRWQRVARRPRGWCVSAVVPDESRSPSEPTAEQRMWAYYIAHRAVEGPHADRR
jgi:hypothetical protein